MTNYSDYPTGKTVQGSLDHGGIKRSFIVYIPLKYDGKKAVPLRLNLHGYASNALEQMYYDDFRMIADSANFIMVLPEGTVYEGKTHWNTGGWTPNSTVDDLGFMDALIDYMIASYKINTKRIYSTGMSNGGEMSYHLACNSSNRIAAIASVGGSMTPETFVSCYPSRPVPVLHIHGTSDQVVPYTGDSTAKPIMEVLNYWAQKNHCAATPTTTAVPNTSTKDNSTVKHLVWKGDKANVEHFKIRGGGHTWAGSANNLPGTNYDINASMKIWKFFNRYDLDGLRKPQHGHQSGRDFAN